MVKFFAHKYMKMYVYLGCKLLPIYDLSKAVLLIPSCHFVFVDIAENWSPDAAAGSVLPPNIVPSLRKVMMILETLEVMMILVQKIFWSNQNLRSKE